MENTFFPVDTLRRFMERAFTLAGVPEQDGRVAADSLLAADLQGISSHGITRFPIYYRRLRQKLVNPQPAIKADSLFPAVVSIDGDNGLGAVVMTRALAEGMSAAERFGLAAVGVRRSNHFGAAGYYCSLAADKGYAAILMTNGPPALPPWGGAEAYFGTNPIAFGLPRRQRPHIIIDMATSAAARGKIIEAAKEGKAIPDNWALDKEGKPTTDAQKALAGVILPMAGPKGYALSLAVEHMAGVLTGAGFGRDVAWQYGSGGAEANVGHTLILLRTDAFVGQGDYFARTERFCEEIRAIAAAPGHDGIKLPGERGWASERSRRQRGIEIKENLAKELREICEELAIELA